MRCSPQGQLQQKISKPILFTRAIQPLRLEQELSNNSTVPIENQNLPRMINTAIFAIVIILGVMLYIAPPAVFPDPANGFRVMRSMEMGGPFNRLIAPAQDDIAN